MSAQRNKRPQRSFVGLWLAVIFVVAGCGTSAGVRSPKEADGCPTGKRLGQGTAVGGLVLGCGDFPGGPEVQLRYRGGCLEVFGIDDELVRGCSVPPTVREPVQSRFLQGSGTVQTADASPIEVYGVALARVDRVFLTYLRDGSPGSTQAELISVSQPGLLRRASIDEGFGLYTGLVPAKARRCKAVAIDSRGEPLGVESCAPDENLAPDAFILGGT